MRALAIVLPVVATVTAAAGAGFSVLKGMEDVNVQVKRIDVAPVSVPVEDPVTAEVLLAVENPTPIPLSADGGTFTVHVEDTKVADGVLPAARVPSGRTTAVPISVEIPPDVLEASPVLAARLAANEYRAHVRVTGEVDLAYGLGTVPVDWEQESVDLKELKALAPESDPLEESTVTDAMQNPALIANMFPYPEDVLPPAPFGAPPAAQDIYSSLQRGLQPDPNPEGLATGVPGGSGLGSGRAGSTLPTGSNTPSLSGESSIVSSGGSSPGGDVALSEALLQSGG